MKFPLQQLHPIVVTLLLFILGFAFSRLQAIKVIIKRKVSVLVKVMFKR